jgi:CO dehydrogenase maturation factor
MKIAVSGKGGSGKTVFCASLGKILAENQTVYMIDADPDGNLGISLGFDEEELKKLKPISELKDLIKERTQQDSFGFYILNPEVSDITEKYSLKKDNIYLLILGTIKKADSGCYCPENTFLKSLISHLILDKQETVIIDLPAGIEVLTRGVAKNVDCLYIIVEPTIKSVQTAQHIKSLAEELKIPQIIFVANKIISSQDIDFINQQLKNKIYKYINYDPLLVEFEQKKILLEQTNFYQQIKNEFCKIYPETK